MPAWAPRDTTPEVREMQVAGWRRMTPAEKLDLIAQMNALLFDLAAGHVRASDQSLSADEVHVELLRRRWGPDLVAAAHAG